MESDQIKLKSRIDHLTSDLVIYRESANKTKKNWTTTSIVRYHLDNMLKENPKKTNNQAPRTIDEIYLTLNLKRKGGYVVLDFKSGIPITRIQVTDIPVKKMVIKAVHLDDTANKIITLKFQNNSGVSLHPNYCMSGVDCEYKMQMKANL